MTKEETKDETKEVNGSEGNGKSNDKKKNKFDALMSWVWNPRKKEFLGRTGSSWAKVGCFYIIFYAFLSLFWYLMLKIFLTTISYDRPKWVLDESLIGLSPGLGFRPNQPIEKVDSTLITFRPGKNESYHHWVTDLKMFLKPYKDEYDARPECRNFPSRNGDCPFLPDVDKHPCGPNFGYDTGSPCVLIKLNRVFNWKPSPFRSTDEINNAIASNPKNIRITPTISNSELSSGEGLIAVQCEGENSSDKEKLSKIEYWPRQGFPAEYYPYTKQQKYLSPFVLVKFNKPSKGSLINIECIALDKKIEINRQDREGSVNYQLLIDN